MTKRIHFYLVGLSSGAILGYLYWYFWACEHGCAITSVWWKTAIFGALFGYLIADAFYDKKTNKQAQINKEKDLTKNTSN